jgi:hypothetical protein
MEMDMERFRIAVFWRGDREAQHWPRPVLSRDIGGDFRKPEQFHWRTLGRLSCT